MSEGATKWIWENSRASNGSLIVLLAIAYEGEGATVEMTTAELARKSRLSERAVQNAVSDLTALGELSFTAGPGRGKRNRYSPCTGNPADSSSNPAESAPFEETPQNLHPEESAGFEQRSTRSDAIGADSAGFEISDMFKPTTGRSLVVVKDVPAKPPRRREDRPDVDRLCTHLADRIVANGNRAPAITGKWRDAARLLIDKDGLTEEQVHAAIDWSQDSEFWRANILSMPKLREKYDTLRQQARRTPKQASGNENLGYIADFLKRNGAART